MHGADFGRKIREISGALWRALEHISSYRAGSASSSVEGLQHHVQHRLHGRSSAPRVAAPSKSALERSTGTMWATCARRITVPLRSRRWNHRPGTDLGPGARLWANKAPKSPIYSETTGAETHTVARWWSESAQEHASSPAGRLPFASDPPALQNHRPEPNTPQRPAITWSPWAWMAEFAAIFKLALVSICLERSGVHSTDDSALYPHYSGPIAPAPSK